MPLDQIDIETDELPAEYRSQLPEGKLESQNQLTFIGHLDVLRKHIFRSLIFVVACAIIVGMFITFFFDGIILAPTKPDFITYQLFCRFSEFMGNDLLCMDVANHPFQNRNLGGQFTMHISLSFTIGIILSFPFIIHQLWQFIKPALKVEEKKTVSGIVFFCSLLFFMGVAFSYYLVVPLTYNFLINYRIASEESVTNFIDISSYISSFVDLNLACGVMFQLPIFVFILSKLGIITPTLMTDYRKHSIIVIFILSAILTPSDVTSMVLVAMPLLLLYEVSIIISKRELKKRNKKELI